MTARQEHGGPCRYNRHPPHGHQFVRGVCRRCGEREAGSVDETPWREVEAARLEYRKAVDALIEYVGRHTLTGDRMLHLYVALEGRRNQLRQAEEKVGIEGTPGVI